MIRTSLSIVALFGSLIFVSKWIQESSPAAPTATDSAVPSSTSADLPLQPVEHTLPPLQSTDLRAAQVAFPPHLSMTRL
jgi:hypothetical protein